MEPLAALTYLALGLVGGVIGGMLGVGGAIGIIPLATVLLAPEKDQLQAAAMVSNLAVAAAAYRRYRRAGQTDWTVARRMVPGTLGAVLVGVGASTWIDGDAFRLLFAAFLVVVSLRETAQLLREGHRSADPAKAAATGSIRDASADVRPAVAGIIGTAMGALSGLLGVGGGVVAVPMLRGIAGMPVRAAVTTSVCVMLPLAAVGASLKMSTLAIEGTAGPATWIAACLVPGAALGSTLGASLHLKVTARSVRWVLVAWLPVAAAWMSWPVASTWLAGR